MNDNPEQRGEPAEASGLPYGTPNPANVTDADKSPASEKTGVDSPAQGTDGTSPPSYTGESGGADSDPEQIRRREAYDRDPE